jgi:hypothetical protein
VSISHKAYLFDHVRFRTELADILHDALATNGVTELRAFIRQHRKELTDIATEEPPEEDWEESIEGRGAAATQQYADLALTKYYDPTDDRGLDHGFDALGAYLDTVAALGDTHSAMMCGYPFGPEGRRLDPGYLGTGLLSESDVKRHCEKVSGLRWPAIPAPDDPTYDGCHYRPASAKEVRANRDRLLRLLRAAARAKTGILFADFNDRGVGGI